MTRPTFPTLHHPRPVDVLVTVATVVVLVLPWVLAPLLVARAPISPPPARRLPVPSTTSAGWGG